MTIVAGPNFLAVVIALRAGAGVEQAHGDHHDLDAPAERADMLFAPGTPGDRRAGPVRAMRPLLRKPLPGISRPEAPRIGRNAPGTPLSAESEGGLLLRSIRAGSGLPAAIPEPGTGPDPVRRVDHEPRPA